MARQLASSPHTSLPQALSPAELKAAYRFFDNDQVDTDGVLAPHIAQTLHRMEQLPVVLAIQDTTEFNLTHLPATDGLGRCTGGNERGFLMHSLLAVSPEGLPLGVLGMKTWARPEGTQGSAAQRKSRPIHEKESIKWIEGLAHLSALKSRCEHTQLIGIGDRESNVYELFAAQRPDGVDWLMRAAWNRCARHPQRYLWQAVLDTPAAGHTELLVPAKGKRPQRTARLTLRYACVRLRPPRTRTRLPELDVFAVHVIEDEPLANTEPIEWMLLTSVPTRSPAQALERLQRYARRWTIETWHRVLKSGCRIEARQFGTLERFVRATFLFAVIAWRILYTTLLARLDGELPCEVVLQSVEGQALFFLPKLGWLRYRNSRDVLGVVKQVTVSASGGKWFVSIQSERDVEQPVAQGGAVGIDMGVARFATLSDGTFYAPLNSFKRHETALRKAQRAMSRKTKFSNNWKKAKARVQRIHSRIGNARRDYLHKATTTISQTTR